MTSIISKLKKNIILGQNPKKEKILLLRNVPVEELSIAANEIRAHFCGNGFDICTIVNGKCGRCSEDCKYCAQSIYYKTEICEHSLLSKDELIRQAKYNAKRGVLRYSIVTSGKSLSDAEVELVCDYIREIKSAVNIEVCVSFGLLDEYAFKKIKDAGASRAHCNLETSKRYFPSICTTHTYDQKIVTLKAAQNAGLSVCSGGIIGLGETFEDRIDLAFSLRELGIKSIPVNFLNPIPGTPFENNTLLSDEDKLRTVAIYRFILPDASIRLAGGRGLIADKGENCFISGANAAISGDMLTTPGITIDTDMKLIKKLGYETRLCNE